MAGLASRLCCLSLAVLAAAGSQAADKMSQAVGMEMDLAMQEAMLKGPEETTQVGTSTPPVLERLSSNPLPGADKTRVKCIVK